MRKLSEQDMSLMTSVPHRVVLRMGFHARPRWADRSEFTLDYSLQLAIVSTPLWKNVFSPHEAHPVMDTLLR